jgi:cellulose synthase/poly-beta-1,6-N-acetylglucosamine synthase-like glycosyltransferase
MIEVVFWAALLAIFHTYFFYPTILTIVRVFRGSKIHKRNITPSVSFIIAAYNEEKIIRVKLDNTLNLNYPRKKLEIIVASDCSTDRTDDIVREYQDRNVRLVTMDRRHGKTAARNQAVSQANGEILVFSDAPTMYKADAIRKLVTNFSDKKVGCVSGDVIYTKKTYSTASEGGALYWRYERWIKQMESDIGSIVGAAGCIYAIRKSLYLPYDEMSDTSGVPMNKARSLDDDFLTPLQLYARGYRSIVEPEAVAIEITSRGISDELRMRSRVITRGISGLFHMRTLLNPLRFGFYSFELISHKVFRWLVPVFMITALVSNCFLAEHHVYTAFLGCQLLFYVLAPLGYAVEKLQIRMKKILIPYYFCLVNFAVLVGILRYVLGKRDITWDPIR